MKSNIIASLHRYQIYDNETRASRKGAPMITAVSSIAPVRRRKSLSRRVVSETPTFFGRLIVMATGIATSAVEWPRPTRPAN